jgi:hypothetical protein
MIDHWGSVWLLFYDIKNKYSEDRNVFDWRDRDKDTKVNISLW